MKRLLIIAASLALCGCAELYSTTKKTTDPKTNVVTEKTKVMAWTFFDSKSDLAKFRNTTGAESKTGWIYPSGTSIGTLSQESSATNVASVFEAIATGLAKGAVQGAK